MSKFLKYGLIGLVFAVVVFAVLYVVKKAKSGGGGQGVKPDEVAPPIQGSDNTKLLNPLSGDGKVLFDTYRKRFEANAGNLSEALQQLDPLSIFAGTKNTVWLDRFVQSSQKLPALLTPKGMQVVKSLSGVTPIGENLWASVSAMRGANFSIMAATGVNLLPGNPEVDSNAFVQDIGCRYAKCPSNDGKRNEAANSKMPEIASDFQRILKNWDALNSSANSLLDIYTVQKIKDAGYNIVA